MEEKHRQWPDNICSGRLVYGKAVNYSGYYLAPAEHPIPTCGAVAEDGVIRPRVFNYPKQTEDIARRLAATWNACAGIPTAELERGDLMAEVREVVGRFAKYAHLYEGHYDLCDEDTLLVDHPLSLTAGDLRAARALLARLGASQ